MRKKAIKDLSEKEIKDRIKNLKETITEVYNKPCIIKLSGKSENFYLRTTRSRLNKMELYFFDHLVYGMKEKSLLKIHRLEQELEKRK